MYPLIDPGFVTQHVDDLRADAAEQRRVRASRSHTERRATTPGQRLSRTIARLWQAIGL
jgi:hypothetical protein